MQSPLFFPAFYLVHSVLALDLFSNFNPFLTSNLVHFASTFQMVMRSKPRPEDLAMDRRLLWLHNNCVRLLYTLRDHASPALCGDNASRVSFLFLFSHATQQKPHPFTLFFVVLFEVFFVVLFEVFFVVLFEVFFALFFAMYVVVVVD